MSCITDFYFLLFCFCLDQQNVTAKPGDNVILQCQSPRDEAITVLEWSRPDLSDGYVFFYRNKRSYEDYQHPTVRGRVQLRDPEMKGRDVSVILKNVTIKDTETYECHVSVGSKALELIDTVILKVEDSGEFVTLRLTTCHFQDNPENK